MSWPEWVGVGVCAVVIAGAFAGWWIVRDVIRSSDDDGSEDWPF